MGQAQRPRGWAGVLGAVVMALAIAFPPCTPALAEQGTITIRQRSNEQASYDAYLVISADIAEDDRATHPSWPSEQMRDVVLSFLDEQGYGAWLEHHHPGSSQHDRPQNAAEYISSMMGSAEDGTDGARTPQTPEGRSFASSLARSLAASPDILPQHALADTPFEGPQGLWLFVTTSQSTSAGEAGTAPIWVPLGGSTTTLYEKASVPTLHKQVQEDSTGSWGLAADAHVGQDISYLLTGTLPETFASYEHYHYRITDTLSEGLDLSVPEGSDIAHALTIRIGDQEVVPDGRDLIVEMHGKVLVVDFADLKAPAWHGCDLTAETTIQVSYQAHLTHAARTGSEGSENNAVLTYTNDPITEGEGVTDPVPTPRAFTYQLLLHKVDASSQASLAGARFTIEVAQGNSDAAAIGCFVQEDGSLGAQPHEFVTDGEGRCTVRGIDEGSYLIRETASPDGYALPSAGIAFSLVSQLSGMQPSLERLTAQTTSEMATVRSVDVQTGLTTLEVRNDPTPAAPTTPSPRRTIERLAQTGVGPLVVPLIASGALLVALALRRKARMS